MNLLNEKNKKNHKLCIHDNCKIVSSFNIEGETKPLYCFLHKTNDMVNVRTKSYCIHVGCKKYPTFNLEGESKRLYCFQHKSDDMVNIVDKPCIYPGCKILPIFNVEGQTKRLYCSLHKLDGMVNIKSKTCIHSNCKTLPIFNIEGETKPLYCSLHKSDDMVNVIDKICIYPGCKTLATFNIEGETKRLYCSLHKSNDMINIKDKICKTHLCYTQVKDKYDGYCLYCYINIFPDKPLSRNYKTKEYSVVDFVKNKYPNLNWISDKKISNGFSKRRPDLLLDLIYQIIIIEIDENQHIDYDCSCENKRIMELSQDVGHRPIIFIRFNPDDYTNNNVNITSCWSQNNKGICVVKKSKEKEWNERLKSLENQINYWINPDNKTNKTIETIQLFYDV